MTWRGIVTHPSVHTEWNYRGNTVAIACGRPLKVKVGDDNQSQTPSESFWVRGKESQIQKDRNPQPPRCHPHMPSCLHLEGVKCLWRWSENRLSLCSNFASVSLTLLFMASAARSRRGCFTLNYFTLLYLNILYIGFHGNLIVHILGWGWIINHSHSILR